MIIGLQGKKRSGKDTVASFFPDNFVRYAWANPIKELLTEATGADFFSDEDKETLMEYTIDCKVLSRYFNLDYWVIQDILAEENCFSEPGYSYFLRTHSSKRKLLQFVGTEIGRELCGKDFWINKLPVTTKEMVVTDIRFQSEVDKIKELGGIILTVERPGLESTDSHSSEQLPNIGDFTMYNDGTLDDLKTKVENLLETLKC